MTLCSECHSVIPVGERFYWGLWAKECYCSNCMSDPYDRIPPKKKEK